MVPLTAEHYAAIGKISVQSGTLERELREYIENVSLNAKPPAGLRRRLRRLREELAAASLCNAAHAQLEQVLDKIRELVLQRNTVVHGVWEADPQSPKTYSESTAVDEVRVRARDAVSVANNMRNARMLLLHLLLDHCPSAVPGRRRPKSDPARLKVLLGL